MHKSNKKGSLTSWLSFVAMAVVVPLLIVWQAWSYLASVNADSMLRHYQIKSAEMLERLRISADTDQFVCSLMNEWFASAKSPQDLQQKLEEFRKMSGFAFDYLIWGKNGKVFMANFAWQKLGADWKSAWQTLFDIGHNRKEVASAKETANLRKIFGPQFFPELYNRCYSGRKIRLILSDSSLQRKLAWARTKKRFSLVAFFDQAIVRGLSGVKYSLMAAANSEIAIGVVNEGRWLANDKSPFTDDELAAVCRGYENPLKMRDWYVFKNTLAVGLVGICYVDSALIDRLPLSGSTLAVLLLLVVVAAFVTWRSFLVFCRGQTLQISIRRQLVILFFLSNTISLLIMALIGFDYLGQYRLFLQTDSFSKGMTYLQSIDEMFVSEFSRQLRRMTRSLDKLKKTLMITRPNRRALIEFLNEQSGDPFRLFLIGSTTPYIGSELGVMKDGKFVEEINMDWARYKSMQTLVEAMGKIGQYYLSLLNRTQVPEMMTAQVELIAESLGQLKPLEMFQEFFAATGSFWQWGMGLRYFPAYIEIFRHPDSGLANYVFLYLWKSEHLQRHYIEQRLTDFNRNPLGLKIMAVSDNLSYVNPIELLKHEQLRLYSTRLRERTGSEIDYCDWQGEKHLLMGLKCNSIDTLRLIGLYPVAAIDRKVQHKKNLLFALALVSILVSLAMGLLVARSVLLPMAELQKGIQALQQHNFAFRLADHGGDEFAGLARLFNTTLSDLEELHVASAVQEKLSDSMSETSELGCLRWFAANAGQSRFAGDYLAVESLSEERVLILIGDVAGSGIGVSLITAYVKACLLQLSQLYEQPMQLLQRLDQLLRQLNQRQSRKFMTMQCALLDCATGEITLANAGHCFPIVVGAELTAASILEMPSTPLGAGRKNDCALQRYRLLPGESLILYTGGLYRNGETGFAHFLESLVRYRDCLPKAWYQTVVAEIIERVGESNCHDDMTLVVVSCKKQESEAFV